MHRTDLNIISAILPRFDLIRPQSEPNTSRFPLIHSKTAVSNNQQADVGLLHPGKTKGSHQHSVPVTKPNCSPGNVQSR